MFFDTFGFLAVRNVMDNYLGTLSGPLGPSWAFLAFSWAFLGFSWTSLGPIFGFSACETCLPNLYLISGRSVPGPLRPLLGPCWAPWALSKNKDYLRFFDTFGFLAVRNVMGSYLGTLSGPLGPSWALLALSWALLGLLGPSSASLGPSWASETCLPDLGSIGVRGQRGKFRRPKRAPERPERAEEGPRGPKTRPRGPKKAQEGRRGGEEGPKRGLGGPDVGRPEVKEAKVSKNFRFL